MDSKGTEDSYEYDLAGRELSHSQQGKDGEDIITTSKRYDKNGNVRFETDGNDNTKEYKYDELNRLVSSSIDVTNSNGTKSTQTTKNYYDKNGNLIKTTDWRGRTLENVYDPINRLIEKKDPDGLTIQKLEYYDSHLQKNSIDGKGKLTSFGYDKNNRLLSTTDQCNHVTSKSYDEVGNVATKKDGNGNVTSYEYDELGRLVGVLNAKNEKTSYGYDLNGNMTSMKDADGNITTMEYNAGNKVSKKVFGGTGKGEKYLAEQTELYTYYGDGSLKTELDRNGNVTSYEYDVHGRLATKRVKEISIEYQYDNVGNMLLMKDPSGETRRSYDELGRAITKSVSGLGTSIFNYDLTDTAMGIDAGFIGELSTDVKGNQTLKVFDKLGRLKKVQDGNDKATIYEYDRNEIEQMLHILMDQSLYTPIMMTIY